MTEVLLKELSNSDIDWILATGRRRELAAGDLLIKAGKAVETLNIVLEGTLVSTVPQSDSNPLARAFASIEGTTDLGTEIARLSSGEVVGEVPFIGIRPTAMTVKAMEKSLVLSIPQQQLAIKLEQDVDFAARFYRAIAILLLDRLQSLIERFGRSKLIPDRPIKDMLFVLGDLHDSDIDWMMAAGKEQRISANTVLIREGRPIDAFYVLLNGTMTASISESQHNPLSRVFAAIEGEESKGKAIARLSKGEMLGETVFIDSRLPFTTVQALENSLVLSIPRQQLIAKLQQDVGFAARFYRAIATLLSNRLQSMLSRLGYGRRVYSNDRSLSENIEYDDELDLGILERMAVAGKRFDWMLGNLKKTSA